MSKMNIGTREEYDKARAELLVAEKDLTKQRDEVTKLRQALPWVKLDKEYTFTGPDGKVNLTDLFENDNKDMILVHLMFDPTWELPCSHCSHWADGYSPLMPFFEDKFNFVVVGKAPYEKLEKVKVAKGWEFPFYSSSDSDFNKDFDVEDCMGKTGGKEFKLSQGPGVSVFRKEGGEVYHTYSTYRRGLENFNAMWAFLDILPFGREGWAPKHREEYKKKRKPEDNEKMTNGHKKEKLET